MDATPFDDDDLDLFDQPCEWWPRARHRRPRPRRPLPHPRGVPTDCLYFYELTVLVEPGDEVTFGSDIEFRMDGRHLTSFRPIRWHVERRLVGAFWLMPRDFVVVDEWEELVNA